MLTKLTRRVPLVDQELLTLPKHLSSPPVLRGIGFTRSLVLYVCFVDRCLFFCAFFFWRPLCCLFFFWPLCCLSFGHCVVCLLAIVLSVLLAIVLSVLPRYTTRVAQWVRSLDLTTHISLSPIWREFTHGFVNYKKGALDSQPQVIKFTSCLPMVGGSLRVLRLPPALKPVAMI